MINSHAVYRFNGSGQWPFTPCQSNHPAQTVLSQSATKLFMAKRRTIIGKVNQLPSDNNINRAQIDSERQETQAQVNDLNISDR